MLLLSVSLARYCVYAWTRKVTFINFTKNDAEENINYSQVIKGLSSQQRQNHTLFTWEDIISLQNSDIWHMALKLNELCSLWHVVKTNPPSPLPHTHTFTRHPDFLLNDPKSINLSVHTTERALIELQSLLDWKSPDEAPVFSSVRFRFRSQ